MTLVAQGLIRAPTVVGASRLRVKEVRLEGAVNYPADSGTKCPAVVNAFIKFLVLIIRRIS